MSRHEGGVYRVATRGRRDVLLYRAVKAEAIFMILQIEGREPDDFKNKPTEDVKGACCNAELPTETYLPQC